MEELITVVVPNYNKGQFIKTCIDSVMNQTYKELEVIVVDDCSTDDSLIILKELQNTYLNLVVFAQKQNKGVSSARNKGVELAHGSYVTFLDSDDLYINPNKLENEYFIASKFNCLAYSKIVRIDNDGGRSEIQFLEDSQYFEGDITLRTMLGKNRNTIPRDFVFKKELFVRCGGFTDGMNLYEDLDFLLRLCQITDVRCTFQEGTGYRQVGNGLSSKPDNKKNRIRWQVCWKHRTNYSGLKYFKICICLLCSRLYLECKEIVKSVIR